MKNSMKILTIGDIHGRSSWKEKLFRSTDGFRKKFLEKSEEKFPIDEYEKIIFVGDYVDSYDLNSSTILRNLLDIIELKKAYLDKVVLLLGNHDVHYFVRGLRYDGHRPEMMYDLRRIFESNSSLFQVAFSLEAQEFEGRSDRKILWTHAGVTNSWFEKLNCEFYNEDHYKSTFLRDYRESSDVEKINVAFELLLEEIFWIGQDAGGFKPSSGPLWIRPKSLRLDSLEGYDQIVGHTFTDTIKSIHTENGNVIVLTDCLSEKFDFFEFEI